MTFYALRKMVKTKSGKMVWGFLGKDYKITLNVNRAKPYTRSEAMMYCSGCLTGFEAVLVSTTDVKVF